jgi:signal transduction histidine kinase
MNVGGPPTGRNLKDLAVRYGGAFLAIAAALLISRGLKPFLGDSALYLLALPAIALAALRFGMGPSLVAVASALLGAKYWFMQPVHSLRIDDSGDWAKFFAFLIASSFIVALAETRHKENERLRNAQGELEEKVNRRTAELHTANQSLSDLTARLLHLQDEERRRIARDLHDSVGQSLIALGMNLSFVEEEIERLRKMASLVKDSKELVRENLASIRNLSYLLHPPLLDENGLSSALPWYTRGLAERSNIKVDLELSDELGRLSRDSEVAIFRIVQECLTNVIRHSESTTAAIRIAQIGSDVSVEVRDTGKGIPPDKLLELTSAGTPGVGLRGMQERIRQLGGTLEINSEGVGRGTLVIARLPYVGSLAPGVSSVPPVQMYMPQNDTHTH